MAITRELHPNPIRQAREYGGYYFYVPIDSRDRNEGPGVDITFGPYSNVSFLPETNNADLRFTADDIALSTDWSARESLLGRFEVYRSGEDNRLPFGATFLAALLSRYSSRAGLLDVAVKPHECIVGLRSRYDIPSLKPAAAQIARAYPSSTYDLFLPSRMVRLEQREAGKPYGFPFDQVKTD